MCGRFASSRLSDRSASNTVFSSYKAGAARRRRERDADKTEPLACSASKTPRSLRGRRRSPKGGHAFRQCEHG